MKIQKGCSFFEYKKNNIHQILIYGNILGMPNETGTTFNFKSNKITSIEILGLYDPDLMKAISKTFINKYGTKNYDGKSETFYICTTLNKGTCVNSPKIDLNKIPYKYKNSNNGHIYNLKIKTNLIYEENTLREQMKQKEHQYNQSVIKKETSIKNFSESIEAIL